MRILSWSFLAAGVLTAGCGSKNVAAPIGNAPPSGKQRLDCPTGDELTATARTYFASPPIAADGGDVGATCVAVFLDRSLWLLDGWHASPTDDMVALVTALVDPVTGKAVWTTGAGDFDFPPGAIDRMTGSGMTAVDLDGDGRDEIVNISGTMAQGYDSESLAVLAIGPAGLIAAGEIPFAEDNGAAGLPASETQSCATEWKLVAGPEGSKQLDLTVTTDPPGADMCLPAGHHVMRWTGKTLEEVH